MKIQYYSETKDIGLWKIKRYTLNFLKSIIYKKSFHKKYIHLVSMYRLLGMWLDQSNLRWTVRDSDRKKGKSGQSKYRSTSTVKNS